MTTTTFATPNADPATAVPRSPSAWRVLIGVRHCSRCRQSLSAPVAAHRFLTGAPVPLHALAAELVVPMAAAVNGLPAAPGRPPLARLDTLAGPFGPLLIGRCPHCAAGVSTSGIDHRLMPLALTDLDLGDVEPVAPLPSDAPAPPGRSAAPAGGIQGSLFPDG